MPPERLDELRRVAENFAVALTEDVAALIDPADPDDPIAAQFVPRFAELQTAPEEGADPIGDERWSPVAGIAPLSRPGAAEADPRLPGHCRLFSPRAGRRRGGACRPTRSPARLTTSAPGRKSGKSSSRAAIRCCCRRAGSARSSRRSMRSACRGHPLSHPRADRRSAARPTLWPRSPPRRRSTSWCMPIIRRS